MKFSCRSVLAVAVAALAFAPGAWAQGCVLCYTSLASSGPAAMHAFQLAMFALLIPALLLFLGVFLLIFRPVLRRPRSTRRGFAFRWLSSASSAKPLEGRA
jgi:hypothetical protein